MGHFLCWFFRVSGGWKAKLLSGELGQICLFKKDWEIFGHVFGHCGPRFGEAGG